jgi:nucleoid DNA-binding protein
MNNSELVDALSKELKFPIKTTQNIIDTILDTITEKLVAGVTLFAT